MLTRLSRRRGGEREPRRVLRESVAAHAGHWEKSAAGRHTGVETLGMVRYAGTGGRFSTLAEAMGIAAQQANDRHQSFRGRRKA